MPAVSPVPGARVTLNAKCRRGLGSYLAPAIILLAIGIGAAGAPMCAFGQTAPRQPSGNQQESPDDNGLDYTRPQQNAELRLMYRTSSAPTTQTDQERTYLKLATKIELPDGWKFGLQGQLPFVDKQTTNLAKSMVDRENGFGDAFAQAVLSHSIDSHWAYGFGARVVAPTAQDSLGSGKWQVMPGFGVRYSFLEISADTYFVPSVRYALSVGGDPTRRNINEPQIAPTLNIALPDHWFVTLYPSNDIRINYGDQISGQKGRLFFPFDLAIGKPPAKAALS